MTIRPATAADVSALHAIAAANPTAPQWTPQQFAESLQQGPAHPTAHLALVADHNGTVAGFAIASALVSLYPIEAELESIAVSPAMQGQGIGRALLHAVIDWCRRQNAATLRLEVRVGNAPAIALYQSAGFASHGVRRAYYTAPPEDAICMSRKIF